MMKRRTRSVKARTWWHSGFAENVGQVGNLRPIVNRPAEAFEKLTTGRFPIGHRMPSCPTSHVLSQSLSNALSASPALPRTAVRQRQLAVDTIRFASSYSGEVTMFVPLTPIRCLHRAVDLFGKRIGVVSGARQFTYAEFGERCERLATALSKEGISHGDRVAYLSFNNHQLLEGYFGVVQARAIVMPLNVRLSPFELTNILCHSGARMLLFENDFAPLVEQLRPACPEIHRFVTLNEKVSVADLTYEELLDKGHAERA